MTFFDNTKVIQQILTLLYYIKEVCYLPQSFFGKGCTRTEFWICFKG